MGRVASFEGISVYIYPDDHNPPHFHVYYSDFSAIISISTLEILQGSLPANKLSKVKKWAEKNYVEIVDKWNELNGNS